MTMGFEQRRLIIDASGNTRHGAYE